MLTGHVTHQAPIIADETYQPTIVRQDNLRNLPLFCGTAPAASVHDLDTFEKIAQGESRGNRYTISELKAATSAEAGAAVDPAPAPAPAAVVPAAASELCVLPRPADAPPCAAGFIGRAFGLGPFLPSPVEQPAHPRMTKR